MQDSVNNYHVTYLDVYRYWSSHCERYAGGDSLVTMLMNGWNFTSDTIYFEEYWHAGTRPVTVFHFELIKDGDTMLMPVITNPYVRRVIRMHQLKSKSLSEKTEASGVRNWDVDKA